MMKLLVSLFFISNIKFWRINCQMLQAQYADQPHISQSQIYDDLSQIIKFFKIVLTSMENIANNLYKYDNISNFIDQLKQSNRNLQSYINVYSYPIELHFEHKNTFHRFICRLLESISAFKLKLQNQPFFIILSNDINEMENIIISYQRDKNIGLIIKKIQAFVNKFCLKTIKKSQIYTKSVQRAQENNFQEKNIQSPSLTRGHINNQQAMTEFYIGIEEEKPKKVIQCRSQNSLNKVMNLLNRRYRTLSCLDMDYQEFKYLFIRSRDSKDDLFEDCLQRNSFICRQIVRYSKQFSEYLQKKELKIYRKNKFIDSLPNQVHLKIKTKFSGKFDEPEDSSYNFMKKKVFNEFKKNPNQYHPQHTSYVESPTLLIKSEVIDASYSNLASIQQQKRNMTPLLNDNSKRNRQFPHVIKANDFLNQKEKLQQISGDTFMEISRRKKNLQLKKIDISLTTFMNAGQTQTVKNKNKLLSSEAFKKSPTQTSKQIQEKIPLYTKKNYIQKKYDQAMKKNIDESFFDLGQIQKNQNNTQSKYSSAKCIEVEENEATQNNRQKRCLFKTTNKRPLNSGNYFHSLHPVNQWRQISTIKNFRKLKMDQVEKVQKIQKMKEKALNQMEICSGGRAIRPNFMYRPKDIAQNIYKQSNQNDFADTNLGLNKQSQTSQRFRDLKR